MAMAEIPPGVHLPAPQREQGQQVFPRLALLGSQGSTGEQGLVRESREEKRGKAGMGLCFLRAQAAPIPSQGVLEMVSHSESNNPMPHPVPGAILWVAGSLPQGHRQQL